MHSKTRSLILAALFAALTAIGAFLKIPLGALSLTLQFFFTAMAGVLLGPRWGAASRRSMWCWGWRASPSLPWAAAWAMCSSPASASCWD